MLRPPLSWAFEATTRLPTLCVATGAVRLYTSNSSFPASGFLLRALNDKDVAGWKNCNDATAANGTRHSEGATSHRRRLAIARRNDAGAPLSAGQGTGLPDAIALVKQLRERTAVSVGLCKQALEASNWVRTAPYEGSVVPRGRLCPR